MTSRTFIAESGFESETSDENVNSSDGLRKFHNFIGRLEDEVLDNGNPIDEDDDPTIDLNLFLGKDLAVRPPSPIRRQKTNHNQTHQITAPPSSVIDETKLKKQVIDEELDDIVSGLKRGGRASKLESIMLRGLKQTLGVEVFNLFLQDKLPPNNWLPIVRMNEDNTPYVEFLVKSNTADEDPFSQLNAYTIRHQILSQTIIDHLRKNSKQIEHPQQASSVLCCKTSQKNCSTPLQKVVPQKTVPQKRSSNSIESSHNDSKRILPNRSCKSKSTNYWSSK